MDPREAIERLHGFANRDVQYWERDALYQAVESLEAAMDELDEYEEAEEDNARKEQGAMEVPGSEASEAISQVAAGGTPKVQITPFPGSQDAVSALRALGRFGSHQIVPPAHLREHFASGSHSLTYHGGLTLSSPKLVILYAGWQADRTGLEAFAKAVMEGGYLDPLKAYGSGRGTFLGAFDLHLTSPAQCNDAWCQSVINWAVQQTWIPRPDGQTIYSLFLADSTTVSLDGQASCSAFCGYHSAFANVIYTVEPTSSCAPCHGNFSPDAARTMVLAHEIAEACSNPTGQGWYEDATGMENADLCAWQGVAYGQWTVQPYYTNEAGCAYGQYQPQQPPPGPPPPSSDLEARVAKLEASMAAYVGWYREMVEWLSGYPT